MAIPLRVLIVEDSAADAELMLLQLTKEGFQPDWQRVETEPDFLAALGTNPDLILADWHMPHFSAPQAMKLMHARGLDTPFVIVSGSIGEEAAIDALRQGADDYVLKDRPARLGQAVQHALEDNRMRQERKRLEEILVKERQELNLIIDTSPIIIFYKDKKGRFIRVNKVFAEALKMSAEDFVGKTDFDLYPPEIAQGMTDDDREVVQSGHAKFNIVEQYISVSGVRWVQTDKVPIFDENGKPVGLIGFAQDITERKKAEDALRANELRLSQIYNTVSDALFDLAVEPGDNFRFVSINKRFLEITGLSEEQVVGKHYQEVIPEPAHALVLGNYKKAVREKNTVSWEEVSVYPTGTRYGDIFVTPFFDKGGKCIRLIGTVHDITERKRAEEALSLKVEQLLAINQASQVVTASLDLDQVLTEIMSLAGKVTASDYTSIVLVDEAGHTKGGIDDTMETPSIEIRLRGKGFTRWIVHTRKPVTVDNVDEDGAIRPKVGGGAPRTANPGIVAKGIKSFAGLPLIVKDRIVGVLYLHSMRTGVFSDQLPLLTTFANQAAVAIEKARLYAEAQKELAERKRAEAELQASREAERNFAQRLTTLSEVTTELSKAESLDALCRGAVELGRERLDFDRLAIWFFTEDRTTILGTFGVNAEGRITDERASRHPLTPKSNVWPVVKSQIPLLHLRGVSLFLDGQVVGQGSQVCAGLWDGEVMIGYVAVDNLMSQRLFSDSDCELIRLYASAVGHLCSLQRAQEEIRASQEAERNFAERLTVLSEVTTELSTAGNLDELCRRAVELGRERLDFDRLCIWFLTEDRTSMRGTFGVDSEGRVSDEHDHQFAVESGLFDWPVVKGDIPLLLVKDAPLEHTGQRVGRGDHVSVGLLDGKDVIGYISLDNLLSQRPFSDNDCEIIRLFASALGHLVSLQRAQEEIRASEERFEKSFQSSPIATIINVLPGGQMVDVNDAFLSITGYNREEIIGKTGLEVGLWADPNDRIRLAKALITEETLRNIEGRLLTKSGESRDMLASAETIQIAGQPHGLIMLNDITERKRAEAELQASREAERNFAQRLTILSEITTELSKTENLDELCRRAVELGRERLDFDRLSIWFISEDRTFMRGTFGMDVEGRIDDERENQIPINPEHSYWPVIQGQVPLIRLMEGLSHNEQVIGQGTHVFSGLWDGEITIGYLSVDNLLRQRPIDDRDCEIIRLYASAVGHLVSIKRAEDELHDSEERYRLLFELSPDAIAVYQEGKVVFANQAAVKLLGADSLEDFIGKPVMDFVHPDYRKLVTERMREQKVEGKPVPVVEEKFLRLDGTVIDVDVTAAPINYQNKASTMVIFRDITERKQTEEKLAIQAEELSRSNDELARLYRASGSLISGVALNFQDLAQKIVAVVQQEFGQSNCSLIIVQKESNELVRLVVSGSYADQVNNRKLTLDGPGLVPLAIRTNKAINCGDVHSSPDYVQGWGAAESEMAVPLKVGSDAIGAIDVQSSEPNAFSPDDERLMTVFAERAALSLEHSRLNEQTEARLQQLTALRTVDMAISGSFDLHLTLGILLDQLKEQLGVHAADILVFNASMQTFEFASERGFRTQMLQRTQFKFGAGYAWRAIRERRVVNIPDISVGPDGLQRSPDLSGEQFVAYLGVPLVAKGEIQGVLEVFHREPLVLEKEMYAFLEMLAGQAAIAINNAELFNRLQTSNADLTMAYDATLEGWASALELRDKETEGHTRRVTEVTMQLARSMGVKESELVHIYRGAVLHDIGKMGVPDHIMLKPGPLTEDEWTIMRKHPQYAYDMISQIAFLRNAIDIPYCHHEKWDGTGYPRGLKGTQIPLAARIFSVVDVWDALTSDRPYRKAWTEAKARQYIQDQEGLYFDPQVVRVFLKESFRKE